MHVTVKESNPGRHTKWRPGHYIYDSGYSEPWGDLQRDGYCGQARAAMNTHQAISRMLKERA